MWPSEGIVYHVLAALALLVAGTQQVTSAQDRTFQPVTVIRRPFPAIKDAKFVSAQEGDNELLPEELVLGVVLGEQARAYPINMLKGPRREIINDTLGGVPIAATW